MVFLFWRGRGWVVAVGTFLSSLAMEWMTRALTGDETYYQRSGFPLLVALSIAGALSWFLGDRWNRDAPKEGLARLLGSRAPHTLFSIRMERWGVILPILGVAAAVYRM